MPKPPANQEDEDPTPYLFVSLEQKRIDQTKPYDAKKSCWVPDEKEGFVLGEIRGTKGDLVTVFANGEVIFLYNYQNNRVGEVVRYGVITFECHVYRKSNSGKIKFSK